MKKIIPIIVGVLLAIALVAFFVISYLSSKTKFNDDNAVGNTAGNLNNGGMFCEYKDVIYFANPYDNYCLYSMDSDCTNINKLNNDTVAYVNVNGNYIYYVRNNFKAGTIGMVFRGQLFGVYRTNLNGKKPVSLYDKLSGIISLSGNYVIYQHYDDQTALSLHKTKIDKSEQTKISDNEYNPASIYNGKIYFPNMSKDHNIYTLDPKTNSVSYYCDANAYLVDMTGSYLYYIELDDSYSLVRLDTSTRQKEVLVKGRCINFNRYNNKIFYCIEGGDKPGLYRMNIDGSDKEFIANGSITNIHCTSQYTFFQYFNEYHELYRVPTTGNVSLMEKFVIE